MKPNVRDEVHMIRQERADHHREYDSCKTQCEFMQWGNFILVGTDRRSPKIKNNTRTIFSGLVNAKYTADIDTDPM